MKNTKEVLPFREIGHPILSRLPKGCYVVVQDGWNERGAWAKYGIYSKKGFLIALTERQTNKQQARKYALQQINNELRNVALIYGNTLPSDFSKILEKY